MPKLARTLDFSIIPAHARVLLSLKRLHPTSCVAGLLFDSQWTCGGVGEKVPGGSPRAGRNVWGAGIAESRETNSNSQGKLHFTEFDHELAKSVVGILFGAFRRTFREDKKEIERNYKSSPAAIRLLPA